VIHADHRKDWEEDCLRWRGRLLNPEGRFAHWCNDWDDLPMDDTCDEFPDTCSCYTEIR